ncbi:Laminin G domain protein [compost metagenome]
MITYSSPVSVVHRGLPVVVCLGLQEGETAPRAYYNILHASMEAGDDAKTWGGYRELAMPTQLSPAGMSVLRAPAPIGDRGLFQIVSDQEYVYLFRATPTAIHVNRYVMAEEATASVKNASRMVLQPAWEVRYRRSGKADLPASDQDAFAAKDLDGKPYLEPFYELPIDPRGLQLDSASFAVQLLPSSLTGGHRWQLFVCRPDLGQVWTYSFERSEDGWFAIDSSRIDAETRCLIPDARISLTYQEQPFPANGSLAVGTYSKQEPVATTSSGVVTMRRMTRSLLIVPSTAPETAGPARLATLDFAVAADGTLSGIGPGSGDVAFEAGRIGPMPFMLSFDGKSAVTLPADKPLTLPQTFTLEAWVMPMGEDLAPQVLIGGAAGAQGSPEQAPALWIANKLQIAAGYGDGSRFVGVQTRDNVLTLGSWTHVAVTSGPEGIVVYVNGQPAPLAAPAEPGTPIDRPLTSLGGVMTAPSGKLDARRVTFTNETASSFSGKLDEVRVWTSTRQASEIQQYLYSAIPDDVAKGLAALAGYWRLNDGRGVTASDASQYDRDGAIVGASWEAQASPMEVDGEASLYLDPLGLATYVGVLAPADDYPLFGTMKPGTRPSLLDGADGLVHLYYQASSSTAQEGLFCVAQYDASIDRARYAFPWRAGETSDPAHETGTITFIARQSGAALNAAKLSAIADKTAYQATLTLDDGKGTTETWRGIPAEAHALAQVLTGNFTGDPRQFATPGCQLPFYDLSGKRRVGVQPLDPSLRSAFWFVANTIGPWELLSAALGEDGAMRLTFRSDAAHPEEQVTYAFPNVPTDAEGLAMTLTGLNLRYPYPQPTAADAAKAYALSATLGSLAILVPGTSKVTAAAFAVGPGWNADVCNFAASVTVEGEPPRQATWSDLPRDVAAFVAALQASSDPEQRAVVALLRFHVPGAATLLDGDAAAGLAPVLDLASVVNDGGTGPVAPFTCALEVSQGASSVGAAAADLTGGSAMFAVQVDGTATNGCVPTLDVGSGAPVTAGQTRPGRNGGWLFEAPRIAVHVQKNSGLKADTSAKAISALEIPGSVTVESWVRMTDAPANDQPFYPRIVHANFEDSRQPVRYVLGLVAGSSLEIVQHSRVATADPAGGKVSLFPSGDYTVQFYLNPDLSTLSDDSNSLYTRTTSKGSEALRLDQHGNLTYVITLKDANPVASAPIPLVTHAWQQITLTRKGARITLTVTRLKAPPNGGDPTLEQIAQKLEHVPDLGVEQGNAIQLAGNPTAAALQGQLSTFSLWRRGLTAEEITRGYNRPIDPSSRDLQLLWNLDGQGSDRAIRNVAQATQGSFDTALEGDQSFWWYPGLFYRAFFGHGDQAVVTRYPVLGAQEWTGIAGAFKPRYGVTFANGAYADCGADDTLNLGTALTLEAWVKPKRTVTGQNQALLSKFAEHPELRSYELGLNENGYPYLTIRADGMRKPGGQPADEKDAVMTFTGTQQLQPGKAYYLAATLSFESLMDATSVGTVYCCPVAQIYVDGVPTLEGPSKPTPPPGGDEQVYRVNVIGGSGSGWYRSGDAVKIVASDRSRFAAWRSSTELKFTEQGSTATFTMPSGDVTVSALAYRGSLSISQSPTALNLGRASVSDGSGRSFYTGGLSDVRLWSSPLTAEEVAAVYAWGTLPASENLVTAYAFTEQVGMIAYDSVADNNARLSNSDMWAAFPEGAHLALWVNGREAAVDPVPLYRFGNYGIHQFLVGGAFGDNQDLQNSFPGDIDEVRVWSELRTPEQIADHLHTSVTGNESHLAGYWSFSTGSGRVALDWTGKGNDLAFFGMVPSASPTWVPSSAPVTNEGPAVYNVLGGLKTTRLETLVEGPVAFEYGESQQDSRGASFALMKRGYAYVTADGLQLFTGLYVGDLQMVYLGQVQTKPSLVGYIESTPPMPSENFTRPYYLDPVGRYEEYASRGSVKVEHESATEITIQSSRTDTRGIEWSAVVGAGGGKTVNAGPMVPPAAPLVLTEAVKWDVKAGVQVGVNWSTESSQESSFVQSYTRRTTFEISNGGDWEKPGEAYLLSKERRYVPDTTGVAIVKSATANLYGLFLKATGSLVAYSVLPDPDIPVDTNLIYFPVNPNYVKNGTLDGRIGFQDDPETGGNPSYFKPREAYQLQRAIDRKHAQLQAWYQQFDASGRAHDQNRDLDGMKASAPLYDVENDVPRQDICNKYVWTAGGGLYQEEGSLGAQRQESYGGMYALQWRAGFKASVEFEIGPVGLFFETDLLGGTGWNVSVSKAKNQTYSLSLDIGVEPEYFLRRFLGPDKDPVTEPTFSDDDVPGKVDIYRFMSFYRAPSTENTDVFFNQVIDPQWLELSPDPHAASLRQARGVSAGQNSWRVLHRVTFVSRIPPSFQITPVESQLPPETPPVRLSENQYLLGLLELNLSTTSPTPQAIAAAVNKLLNSDLQAVLPWWPGFLEKAAVANSPEAVQLAGMRADLLAYARSYYDTLRPVELPMQRLGSRRR